MFRSKRIVGAFIAWAVIGLPGLARGQTDAAADALFQQAKEEMKAGNYDAACPRLDDSYKLDRKPGTLFSLAYCREQQGRIATAVTHYRAYLKSSEGMTAAQRSAHQQRMDVAKERLKALDPEVPTMKLSWGGRAPERMTMTIDGADFGAGSLDAELPFDPGEHTIVIRVPGQPEETRKVTLEKGRKGEIVDLSIPQKTADEPPKGPTVVEKEPPKGEVVGPVPVEEKPSTKLGWRPFAIGGAALGGAALVAGGVLGGLALSGYSKREENCKNFYCNEEGLAGDAEVHRYANWSTALLVVGGVATLGGVIPLLLAKPSEKGKSAASEGSVEVRLGVMSAFVSGVF